MRLFVAIKPPDHVLQGLQEVIDVLARDNKRLNVSWTFIENLHATVFFLGEVAEGSAPFISEQLSEISQTHEPFYLEISQFVLLPTKRRPRVIAAGLHDQSGTMRALHVKISDTLIKYTENQKTDKKRFKPHMTLGRNKSTEIIKVRSGIVTSLLFQVTHIRLMKSELGPLGTHYTTLSTHELKQNV